MVDMKEFELRLHQNTVELFEDVKAAFEDNEDSHTENLCYIIEQAARIHEKLMSSERRLNRFYELPFWGGRKYRPNTGNSLLHCMQYLVGAVNSDSSNYNKASDYTAAVKRLNSMGCSCEDLYDELVRVGGPYALLNKNNGVATIDQRPKGGQTTDIFDGDSNYDGGGDSEGQKPSSGHHVTPADTDGGWSSKDDGEGRRRPFKLVRLFEKNQHIALTAGNHMNYFFEMVEGEEVSVLIKRVADEGSFSRFEVQSLERLDS